MGSSIPILNSDAQKRIAKSGFGRKFHEFKYLRVGFLIFLKIIIELRAPLKILCQSINLI